MGQWSCHMFEVDGTSGTLQRGGVGSGAYIENIIVGTAAASGVITIYAGTDNTGTVRATIDATTSRAIPVKALFNQGFYLTVTGGAAKVSVVCS